MRKISISFSAVSRIAFGLVLLLGLASGEALAEIYKWKDSAGRLHFAQDLNQVPPKYRAQAAGDVVDPSTRPAIQTYEPTPPAAVPKRTRGRKSASGRKGGSGETYRIRVAKTGSSMYVQVRLNDNVTAPFIIDTGASDVLLPLSVANELGVDLEGARTGVYSTANGLVKQSLITLDSVNLGGARAENVPASVSPTMSIGLLGLSFFNHFDYQFDPARGIVTLRSNGLAESGQIRGGRSADQWRGQFASLDRRRRAFERELDEINPNWSRRRSELEAEIEEVERQKSMLENEADDARVPMQWRD
ncbi:MAG: TIGR02281 family clan AA aspartic protease [Myxococcota bacterium]